MSAAAAAERGRRLAESLMTSTCSIAPPGISPVTDPETGVVTFPAGTAVYAGKCRVRPAGTQGRNTEAGAEELREFDFLVSVPFAVVGVAKSHHLTVTASPDPALVGLSLEVLDIARGEHITARRLLCNEVA